MKPNKDVIEYAMIFIGSLVMACLIVLLFTLLTGCKLLHSRELQKSEVKTDSSSVKKETETLTKVDTSKSKSESTYTKETFYYGRDTTINNFIIQPNQPAVYIRESGTKKEETQNYNFEDWQRRFTDSMTIANMKTELEKKSETKVKVLDFWQILALGMLGLIVLYMVANKFITLKR